ncbi:AMP-binding protein [Mechercharimyces sp. CAU 1602]|uniref:AMP-binding protein n=1 Tax=Mechercharimyces sp. CAU 1602 TaxID=2973933 RepID=UPI002162F3EB|nr:AMP-binding protein [Mechercharimyces sp. CAU 1602]MCS1351914.1 AMP-binding protein [Mechercharimyces sp. CAU 1602]
MNISKAAWKPSEEQKKKTKLFSFMKKNGYEDYGEFYQRSVEDISWYWGAVAEDMELRWKKPYQQVLDRSGGPMWPRWFIGGSLNISESCLDKWVDDPAMRQRPALVWEADDGQVQTWTYNELWREVTRVATGLSSLGVERGDRVAIYLPMIAENVIAMLAIARIGAIFTPCFSGYGAEAVAVRIQDCEAKMVITADGFLRRGKVIPLKEEADKAVHQSSSIEHVVVVRRLGREIPWQEGTDIEWDQVRREMKPLPAVEMDASDPFMIIYTSGTTGKPKGTVHTHTGFPIKAASDAMYGMDVGKGDVLFWMTDMGWMMGPWMVFSALLAGSAMLIYEGTPDYPQPDRLWGLVERHQVTHLGISPTVIRSLMKYELTWATDHDLSYLRLIGSTGEPWNPEPWWWLFAEVGKHNIPIYNYSGGTEIAGGILGGNLLKPLYPCSFSGPLPGMDADVINMAGDSVRGEVGELVLRQPWVGMTKGFWRDPKRYEQTYWKSETGIWVHGDWVEIGDEGEWMISGRSDDTLKIAGKRLGPAEVESILVDHLAVLEAATIGVPDPIKGESAVCFVVLRTKVADTEKVKAELMTLVSDRLGKALKPQKVMLVSELPKTRNGKILRRLIRSAYLGEKLGDVSSLENEQALVEIQQLKLKNS